MTAVAILLGSQLLTCGAEPLLAVEWLTWEERRRRCFAWEGMTRGTSTPPFLEPCPAGWPRRKDMGKFCLT